MNTNALDYRSFRDALPDVETLNRIRVEYDFSAGTGAVHDIMMPHASGTSDSIPHSDAVGIDFAACLYSRPCTGPNWSDSPRRAFNLRYCSAEGLLGQSMCLLRIMYMQYLHVEFVYK